MKIPGNFSSTLIIHILFLSIYTNAQTQTLQLKTFEINIIGTTNIHDFESKVTELNAQLAINNSNQIESLTVQIPVKSIKSGNKTMDSKTYHAFRIDKNPKIIFKLNNSKAQKINNSIVISAIGTLSMGGKTKSIKLVTTAIISNSGTYSCEGKLDLNMTDYEMTPPTAFMGIMKVGEIVTVNYELSFRE